MKFSTSFSEYFLWFFLYLYICSFADLCASCLDVLNKEMTQGNICRSVRRVELANKRKRGPSDSQEKAATITSGRGGEGEDMYSWSPERKWLMEQSPTVEAFIAPAIGAIPCRVGSRTRNCFNLWFPPPPRPPIISMLLLVKLDCKKKLERYSFWKGSFLETGAE